MKLENIKFRGQIIDSSKWVYGYYLSDSIYRISHERSHSGANELVEIKHLIVTMTNGQLKKIEVDKKSIGVATGLFLNHCEIYTGDKILHKDLPYKKSKYPSVNTDEVIKTVYYEDGGFLIQSDEGEIPTMLCDDTLKNAKFFFQPDRVGANGS